MWLIAVLVLAAATTVLLPFELALLIAFVLNPIITRLSRVRVGRWRVPRFVAVILVYAVIAVAVWFASVALVPQLYAEAIRGSAQLRDMLAALSPDRVQALAERSQRWLTSYRIPVELIPGRGGGGPHVSVDFAAVIAEAIQDVAAWGRERLGDVVGVSRVLVTGTVRAIVFLVLLLMVTAFVLVDAPRILAWSHTLVPSEWRNDWERLLSLVERGLAGVVRGQLTICFINGVLTLIGLLLLNVPFPFALSALATVLYLVPLFGTIISSIPIVLLGLSAGGLQLGLASLAWIVAIHALETYVLNPKIMGDASKIHPVLIVLALVVGEHHFGIVGALLAVPVASVVASVFKFIQLKAGEEEARLAPLATGTGTATAPAPAPAMRPPATGKSENAPAEAPPELR
jgi:predicted PurR-regulated permease PerM